MLRSLCTVSVKNLVTRNVQRRCLASLVVSADLQARIHKFDIMRATPLSLQQLLEASFGQDEQVKEFLQQEYSIRCAERICMIQERIPNFHSIPELEQAFTIHVECFQAMQNCNLLNDDFTAVVRSIVDKGRNMVPLMCMGMARLNQTEEQVNQPYVDTFLNEFLLNRIGSNVIMSQYLCVHESHGNKCIVDPQCNVTDTCRQTARAVQQLCQKETGYEPAIHVECYSEDANASFAFIPAALSYILQEVLKNSAVATAKKVLREEEEELETTNSTIDVIVCADERRVMIHIGDKAGGIPFYVGQHIWSWLYSTKTRTSPKKATELGGFGVGLPLSRLYANYLGGSINVVSLPNYGTHTYIFLPRLPEHLIEIVPERAQINAAWGKVTRSNGEFIL